MSRFRVGWYQVQKYGYDGLMVIGYAIIIFLTIHYLCVSYRLNTLSKPEYPFQKEFMIYGILDNERVEEIQGIVQGRNVNCSIVGKEVRIGKSNQREKASLFLSADAMVKDGIIDVNEWNAVPNSVVIGKDYVPFVRKENNGRILLNELEFKVYKYLDANEVSNNKIFFNWNNMSDDTKESILKSWMNNDGDQVNSDHIILQKESLFGGELKKMQSLAEIEVMSNQGTNEYIVKQIEWTKYSLIILGVFAMLSIIFICTLWVEKRKREYLIYKAFGFDMVRIICMIFTETGRLVLLSFGLAWFFELICFLFSGNLQGLRMPFLFSCLAVVFIHVLTLALPLFKVWLAKPTQSGIDSI